MSRDVVFLYELRDGPSGGSFGLNVARLAGLPSSVVDRADCIARDALSRRLFETNTSEQTLRDIASAATVEEYRELLDFVQP